MAIKNILIGFIIFSFSESYTQSIYSGGNGKGSSSTCIGFGTEISLPIVLIGFNVAVNEDDVTIFWETMSEVNNDYFTIERSRDCLNWRSLNVVKGAGNSSSLLEYQEMDRNPIEGISYYRLKQTDFDGEFEHSNYKVVNFVKNKRVIFITLFPNPVFSGELINIKMSNVNNLTTTIKITDISGRVVFNKEVELSNDENMIDLPILLDVSSGMYLVTVNSGLESYYQKLVMK